MIKPRCLRRNSGIAVVMAVSVMLLLVSVAMELHLSERANLHISAANRDRFMLDQMAASGVHLAMAVLIKDRLESESDSLQEDWADPETLAALVEEIAFERGQIEVRITDEMGKIQLNSLVLFPEGQQFNPPQQQLWLRFLTGLFELAQESEPEAIALTEDTDPMTIVNALKDWLDSGDDDASTGPLSEAENDYYKNLDPPYECKNGPFDHLSEVRLVKGITPQLFEGLGGAAGLASYLTVYGATEHQDEKFTFKGQININTAEMPVLAALLPLESAGFAQAMVEFREATSGNQYTNDLTQLNWYKNVPGMADVDLSADLVSVSSDTFRIEVTAKLDDMQSTTVAVVQREKESESEPWKCKVLNWKSD
jgi:general secretion pathway protein K